MFRFYYQQINVFLALIILVNCNAQEIEQCFPYDIHNEIESLSLPKSLAEISGMTYLEKNTILCVEDEHGIIYVYDLAKKGVARKITFGKDNDYEGIAIVDRELYVLVSNGTLYEISNFEDKDNLKSNKIKTFLKSDCDAEGLCYDKDKNRLLIACKGSAGDNKKDKHKKAIYEYDLNSKTLKQKPAYLIDVEKVQKLKRIGNTQKTYEEFISHYGKSNITFNPSGIAIHPITHELFILSSSGNTLLVLSKNGQLKCAVHLESKSFKQPEGIAFDKEGTMYISNEARKGKANIKIFTYQPNL